ncbi:hypothetical protein FJV76_29760 [Mesorhizobium sp. WSM4303]|uniref:hypothetical protein n=1 Tax=unclassified Mesorhizobium TaxID=325217 RepID=UPI00115D6E6E|nr:MULTISPECIES: hypothetical protein [unclassified Mesorhizobium]TRC88794.1 hypothetical protein FJV77_30380 [Mesorhizobium sp. WSM4306]TRC95225.1 hypothetical protein FJV76_29760 [Mesorhizobium sp. WSM4303]
MTEWKGVYDILTKDSYTVSVVQNPTLSLKENALVTRRVIDAMGGKVVLGGTPLPSGLTAAPCLCAGRESLVANPRAATETVASTTSYRMRIRA